LIGRLRRFTLPVPQDELPDLPRALLRAIRVALLVLVTIGPAVSGVQIIWSDFTVDRVLSMLLVSQPLVCLCFGLTFSAWGGGIRSSCFSRW